MPIRKYRMEGLNLCPILHSLDEHWLLESSGWHANMHPIYEITRMCVYTVMWNEEMMAVSMVDVDMMIIVDNII